MAASGRARCSENEHDHASRVVPADETHGMEVPEELSSFGFARQRSKLAGTIRGSYFVIEGDRPA